MWFNSWVILGGGDAEIVVQLVDHVALGVYGLF